MPKKYIVQENGTSEISFAHRIKVEICKNRLLRQRGKKAQAYGLLLFGKSFSLEDISIHTEHRTVARLYADSISDLVGLRDSITMREVVRKQRRSVYVVTVDSAEDRRAVLESFLSNGTALHIERSLLGAEGAASFLSGAFLACAAVADPEKGYRVEFITPHKTLCDDLCTLLSETVAPPRETTRRNDYVLYYKDSEHIEDLFTTVGAAKSTLTLMEVKLMKGLRNKVNRATNCETANLSKTVDAAVNQMEDISLIESTCGLGALGDDLQELARLRLENPDYSLRELGEALTPPISRSGVNHRLRRIAAFAEDLRGR